tara:strand:+ start:808 stop:1026 length:219 start_codon:yes stop_codon:yes gene_type:complete
MFEGIIQIQKKSPSYPTIGEQYYVVWNDIKRLYIVKLQKMGSNRLKFSRDLMRLMFKEGYIKVVIQYAERQI